MDEKQLQMLFNEYAKGKGFKDFGEFKSLMDDEASRKVFFEDSNKELGFKDFNDFNATLGVKKKDDAAFSATKLLSQGANVVSGGIFGDISKSVPKTEQKEKPRSRYDQPKQNANRFLDIGEPVVDPNFGKNKAGLMMGQVPNSKPAFAPELAVRKGELQGRLANVLSTGKRPTNDELGQIAVIQSELQSLPQSQADAAFQKDGWSIFKKDPLLGAEFLGETVLSSLTSLFEAGKRTVPAAIGIGAAAGAPIAGIGAIGGAISGLTAGVTTGGFNLSTSGKIIQTLSDEGVDVADRDSLIAAFSDEAKMAKIRNRALKYGIPIAALDAISGGFAGKLVAGAAGKSLAKRTLAGFGEMGMQSVAGMAGEAGGQYLADGKLNRDEILLEGIAGFVTDVPEIVSGVAMEKLKDRSSNKKTLAKQVAVLGSEIGADDAKYNLNRDLANNVITPEEHEQGIAFVEKAVEVNNKIPEIVIGDNRAKSIELIEERDRLTEEINQREEQKKGIDVAYHKVLDESNKEVQKRIDEINNKLGELAKPEKNKVKSVSVIQPEENVPNEVIGIKEFENVPEIKKSGVSVVLPENVRKPNVVENQKLPNEVVQQIPDENIQPPIEEQPQGEIVEAVRVEQEPIVGLNKDNKQPFTTKSKKQVVSFENGDLIVRDAKTGSEVSPKTKKKALREYAESFDFTVGEKAATPTEDMQFRDENELNQYIVDNSQNPSELVEVYVNQEPTTAPLSSIERMVADYGIGKVTNKSFERFGDRNLKGISMAKTYFNNQTGQSIAQVAKEMSDHYDVEITPQDIADFMVRFPNGEASALRLVESEVASNAAAKFKELTGLNLNQEIAQKVIEQQFNKLSKAEQLIAQQDYESATKLEEAYWTAYKQTNGFTEEGNINKPQQEEARDGGEQPKAEVNKQPIGEAEAEIAQDIDGDFFHGTDSEEFIEFDKKKIGKKAGDLLGRGFYFTNKKSEASKYGKNVIKVKLKGKNILNLNEYISQKKYLTDDLIDKKYIEDLESFLDKLKFDNQDDFHNAYDELRLYHKNHKNPFPSYDGIMFTSGDYTEIKVNENSQIKIQPKENAEPKQEDVEKELIIKNAKENNSLYKAPNGQKSNLSNDLWVLVRTKQFKEKFGDWEAGESNVLKDENGEPIKVYHGTAYDPKKGMFAEFDKSKNKFGYTFFSSNRDAAIEWSKDRMTYTKIDPYIVEAFIGLENPVIKDYKGGFISDEDIALFQKSKEKSYVIKNVIDTAEGKEIVNDVYAVDNENVFPINLPNLSVSVKENLKEGQKVAEENKSSEFSGMGEFKKIGGVDALFLKSNDEVGVAGGAMGSVSKKYVLGERNFYDYDGYEIQEIVPRKDLKQDHNIKYFVKSKVDSNELYEFNNDVDWGKVKEQEKALKEKMLSDINNADLSKVDKIISNKDKENIDKIIKSKTAKGKSEAISFLETIRDFYKEKIPYPYSIEVLAKIVIEKGGNIESFDNIKDIIYETKNKEESEIILNRKQVKKEQLKTPLEEEYEEINKKKGEKAQQKAKEKLISDNFKGIVAQLMTANEIKRRGQCD